MTVLRYVTIFRWSDRPGGRQRCGLSAAGQSRAPAVTLGVELEYGGVVRKPVDRRHRHRRVGEDLVPLAEGLIASGDQALALVAPGDEPQQYAGLGLVVADVAEIVEHEHLESVELGETRRRGGVAPRRLQLLHKIDGVAEQHSPTAVDEH